MEAVRREDGANRRPPSDSFVKQSGRQQAGGTHIRQLRQQALSLQNALSGRSDRSDRLGQLRQWLPQLRLRPQDLSDQWAQLRRLPPPHQQALSDRWMQLFMHTRSDSFSADDAESFFTMLNQLYNSAVLVCKVKHNLDTSICVNINRIDQFSEKSTR